MKGYSIYRDNTVIYEFVVDDTISKSLSGNKYVSFTISSKNDLDLKIGDYVLVGNEKYEIFEPIDIEESNGVFTYPLTFYFQGYKLNNSIITDEGATTFAYHGEVSDFMTLLIDSLNEDYPEFTLGTIQNGSILDLSFDNSNCMAALQTVCENAKMEWDITGTIITVKSRIGEETDHIFEYGRNKGSYSVKLAKVANASITTRMIGKGGTLNLPADYVSPDSPKRLNLGNEVLEKNVNKYGKITGVYINENIYPRLINKTVLGVTIPDNIEEAGSWKIKLDIPFNLSDYYADNEVPVVKFQTGDLTGLDFEIVENSWNNTDKTLSIIVKEEEDGYYLPNANRQPRVGDVFVLLNINMPQSYIDEATQELREATQNELNKKCEPQYAPSLSVQKHYIKKKGILLNIGDGITVKIGGRNITTRIIGTTETSDDIRVELGDQMLYTYDTKVNNTIEQIQFTLKQLINIDDIKRLFYNLINAWYPKWFNQKLHKDADVEFNSVKAAELVQSDNFSSKNFTSGALGSGHRIKDGNAEFQNLTVRGQFSVFEFLIQQVKAIGGKFCVSPAAIKTVSVEETENGYKCFFNTDSGTIMNPFVVGDQAFHQVFDGQKMKRYWRLVTEVGADYFVLSKTDCEANSGIPEADEEIVLLGNRTDINRQSAIMISAYDNNSPYIAFYAGINSYSFEGKEPMRTGNLNGIVDEDFGQLTGFGLYCQNVYMKGVFRLMSGKTVEESIGDVQSNLDNLQVGETNLLDNSNKGWKNTGYPIATIYLGDYKPKEGEECTIVIKGKLGVDKSYFGVYNSGGSVVLTELFRNMFNADNIATRTFKWKLEQSSVVADNKFINIYPIPNSVSVESEIEWVKLVLGNKTSLLWTPSINDQKQIATDIAQAKADLAETRANAYADGIVTEAEQNAINEAQTRLDALQIGSQNLISKKMMLKWNEKNKDIAVWGQDEDGVYLRINEALLFQNWSISDGLSEPVFDLNFKPNTQYVFSIEWKLQQAQTSHGLFFRIVYTDGTKDWLQLNNTQTTKTITRLITEAGKTVQKISSSYGEAKNNSCIYNISLIEGNKPLQGFPVAEEDQTGANNVNLADGTKEFTIGVGSTNYTFKRLYVSKIKPNTVYYVNAGNIQNLVGNPDRYSFGLYNKDISTMLCRTLNADKYGGFLITYNNFTEQEGYLLCYAGIAGSTLGNSVKFTEVMLVEGFLPAPVWTPSFTEQQAGIDAANSTATAAQNAVMQVTKSLTELTAENGQIKASVKEVSQKVDTVKTDAEEFTLNNKGNGNNVATAITESFRIDGGYHILKLGVGKAGDIFTLSVETTKLVSAGSQAGKQMLIYTATSTASTYVLGRINATSSVKQIITFTLPQNMKDDVMICATEAWSGTNDVTKLKLEYGNKTTDWTPSTEDQNAITNKAKQEAIVTAASDATTKADTARNAAKSYTDDRTEPLWKGWIDASALDQTKYYPVVFYCEPGRRSTIRLEVALNSGVKPGWSTHASGFSVRCVWSVNGSGYGTTPINRIIDDFAYSFANVIPAGDVGQMTNSSREYIYVRGGGKYYFVATNTGTPFLVTSDYTASNQTISVKTSVTTPAITNATKTEVSSEIKVVKGLIEQKVAKTDYDKNNQVLNQSIVNLQTSYNSISGTVSSLNTRLQTVEKAGFITTSQGNTLYASKKLENGNELISYINQDSTTTTIKAKNINLNGAITANGNVQITTDGKLIAVNGEFTGKITATSGIIGGFEIGSTYIQNGGLKLSSGSIEYKKDKLQSNFGALYTGITGIATGLYIKNTAISTMNRHELCAYFQGSIGDLQINSSKAMIETYNVSSMHYALYIPSGQVYMNANSGGIFFKNVQNVNGKSNYYLCIDRSNGQLYYR